MVARTVRPAPGRSPPEVPAGPLKAEAGLAKTAKAAPPPAAHGYRPPRPEAPPESIEPGRRRRIARERDPIEARIDLHGYDQDRARAALIGFLQRAYDEGARAVLVITGRGTMGGGVLRRRAPEWLAEPALRPLVAGLSPAERRHGGDGAFYVALKRKPRGRASP